jgi:membrane protease YdiL (CAAX protease family)
MLLAYVAYGELSQLWAEIVNSTNAEDKLPTSLGVDESTAALVAVCALVTVIAPIAEEVFFRGYFFGALRNWRGPWPAALVTGAVFGAIHVGSAPAVFLVPLAILGVMLCVVRWRTGSLLPCIALHAINNALAFGVAEDWTAGQTILLMVGAVTVTMLACRAFMAPAPEPA